jgi:hypothetical protein
MSFFRLVAFTVVVIGLVALRADAGPLGIFGRSPSIMDSPCANGQCAGVRIAAPSVNAAPGVSEATSFSAATAVTPAASKCFSCSAAQPRRFLRFFRRR